MEVAEEQLDRHSSSARTLEALKKTPSQKPCQKKETLKECLSHNHLNRECFPQILDFVIMFFQSCLDFLA